MAKLCKYGCGTMLNWQQVNGGWVALNPDNTKHVCPNYRRTAPQQQQQTYGQPQQQQYTNTVQPQPINVQTIEQMLAEILRKIGHLEQMILTLQAHAVKPLEQYQQPTAPPAVMQQEPPEQ